jgi:predicted RNA-binding protein
MCESNVYLKDLKGGQELFFEQVDKIVIAPQEVQMEDIMGVKKNVRARIVEMSLVDHRIILEQLAD